MSRTHTAVVAAVLASVVAFTSADAQEAALVYRLGKDTVAIEQYTRTSSRFAGEYVRRLPTIQRVQYDVTLGADGRPTRAVVRPTDRRSPGALRNCDSRLVPTP